MHVDNGTVLLLHASMLHMSIESPGECVFGMYWHRFGWHKVCTVDAKFTGYIHVAYP